MNLEPGDYLIEVEFKRPVASVVLTKALGTMGFSDVIVDFREPNKQKHVGVLSLVGRLTSPIELLSTEHIAWLFASRISFDPFSNMRAESSCYPYSLHTNKTYELRFFARMRSLVDENPKPLHEKIKDKLRLMGFETNKLSVLKPDMRLADRPNASCVLCYAVAQWIKPAAVITDQDPLFFEDVWCDGQDGRHEDQGELTDNGKAESESTAGRPQGARAAVEPVSREDDAIQTS